LYFASRDYVATDALVSLASRHNPRAWRGDRGPAPPSGAAM